MNAPEVHGTYPVPELIRELGERYGDIFVPRPPGRPGEPARGFPRFPRFEADLDMLADADPVPDFQQLIADGLRQQRDQLDAQLLGHIRRLPPGTLVCVHGVELMSEPGDFRADVMSLTVRQRLHILPEGGTCTSGQHGWREIYEVPRG